MATYEASYDQEEVDNLTGGDFDPIPEDVYVLDIYEAELKEYAPTSDQEGVFLKVVLKVAEGPYTGRQIWDNCIPLTSKWASGKPAFKFKQFFGDALGILQDGKLSFDPEDLLGVQVKAVIKVTPAQKNPDGTIRYDAKNEVKRYLSDDADVAVAIKEPAKPAVKARATVKPGGKL